MRRYINGGTRYEGPPSQADGPFTGISNQNVLPEPGTLFYPMAPPWAWIACFTMESPSPVPPASRDRPWSTR
jgi:hypothetical protein